MTSSAINSTTYYENIPTALSSLLLMILSCIILICLFIHTIYKFFYEDVSEHIVLPKDASSSSLSPRSSLTPISSLKSMKRKRSNSGSITTRARIPSLIDRMKTNTRTSSNLNTNISHHNLQNKQNNISFSIAAFTISYLLWAVIYTLINSIVRILMIFFDVDVSCNLAEYLSVIIVLYKYSLYLIFIVRLHKVFVVLNSSSDSKNMKIFALCSGIFITAGLINFLLHTLAQIKKNDGKCSNRDMSYFGPVLPAIIIDSCINLTLLFLFIQKLAIVKPTTIPSFVIRSQTAILDWSNKTQLARIRSLIKIMTKLTVLVFVSITSTWTLYFTIYRFIPGGTAHIDVVIGAVCVIFCYEFHDKQFNIYCYPCRQCCYNVCFWWFISGEYCCKSYTCKKLYKACKLFCEKCQECHRTQSVVSTDNTYCLKNEVEDEFVDEFEGGICTVCCICIIQRNSTLMDIEMEKIDEDTNIASVESIDEDGELPILPQMFIDDVETIKLKINQKNKTDGKQSHDDGVVFGSETELNLTAVSIVDHKDVSLVSVVDAQPIAMEKTKSFEMEIAQAADEEHNKRLSMSHSRRSVSRLRSVSPESKIDEGDESDDNIIEFKNDLKKVKIDFSSIVVVDEKATVIEHTKTGTMIIKDVIEDDRKSVQLKSYDTDFLHHMSTQPSIQRMNTNTFSFRAMKLRQMQKMLISGDGSEEMGVDFFPKQRPSKMRKRMMFKLPIGQPGKIKKNRSAN